MIRSQILPYNKEANAFKKGRFLYIYLSSLLLMFGCDIQHAFKSNEQIIEKTMNCHPIRLRTLKNCYPY